MPARAPAVGVLTPYPAGDSPTVAGGRNINGDTPTLAAVSSTDPTGIGESLSSVKKNPPGDTGPLEQGQAFGARYFIIRLLGVGGMGAVYQAWDAELGVAVAIKVIRPEIMADPRASAEVERRFKRELLLARQVTHKNVVRIHDLGEIGGIKYITMSYVDGTDLATQLRQQGRLPVATALRIVRSVVSGLVAAHAAGVVHRDLKPANIIIDADGEALIMDFGIARSTGGAPAESTSDALGLPADLRRSAARYAGATMAGTIVGTVEYMSPEQAKGQPADQRVDVYAVGLILHDLLVGRGRIEQSENVVAELQGRMKQPPPPPSSVVAGIAGALDQVVARCLEPDPEKRYQTSAELAADLARLDDNGEPIPVKRVVGLKVLASVVGLALTLLGGTWYYASRPAPPAREPLPVLIANFDNQAKEPLFEGTLEQALGIGIEGASFITTYPRRDALRVAVEIKAGTALDESVARLVAIREGIKTVLAGSVAQSASGYTVTVKALQPDGKIISTATARASSRNDVLPAVGGLASRMRRALGDTAPPKAGEVETFTTVSLEAAHAYALGQENQGKPAEAVRYYLQAVQLDPSLGRAYAGLAAAHVNLKKQAEASDYYKKALSLVDRMSEREKYRTLGTYYLTFANNYEQAIETLRELVVLYPADGTGWNNLATAYSRVGNMADSAAASRHATELSPGNLLRRYNYAVNSMLAGDFATAETEASRVLQSNAGFVYAYLPLALSSLIRGENGKAEETYGRLKKIGPDGASLATMGQADLMIYAGRYQDAVKTLLAGIEEDEKAGSGERTQKLIALAETYLIVGRRTDAARTAEETVQANNADDGIRFLAARVLVEAGEEQKAEKLATELEAKLQKQARSMALIIRGDVGKKRNRLAEAVDAYREAQKQHNSWISRLVLGRAYVEADHFAEALTELEAGEKRAGEATDLFGSNTTTLHHLPPLYYWLGRAREGLGALDAARKSYQRYVAIREHADPSDSFLADARRRGGS